MHSVHTWDTVYRWSFCNSDDDEDREKEIKGEENRQQDKKKEVVEKQEEKEKEGEGEGEGDWEYYYEDLEAGPAPADHKKAAAPNEAASAIEAGGQVDDGWECPTCTLRNPLERPGCLACTTERPAQMGATAAAAAVVATPAAGPQRPAVGGGLDAYKQLDTLDVIPNAETFECVVCFLEIEPGDGVVLRECLHTFCRYTVVYCEQCTIMISAVPVLSSQWRDIVYCLILVMYCTTVLS